MEALFCDLRLATPKAKLITSFTRRGLISEYGVAWILPRLIGQSRALHLLLSARVIMGEEPLAIGLIERLVEPTERVDAAGAFATELATFCSPTALAVVKKQIQQARLADFQTATAEADVLMLQSFQRAD